MGDAVHSESGTNAAKKLTAGKLRSVCAANPQRNPDQPCDYVGMTGLTPKERFTNHKAGMKDAYVVRRFGLRLTPELYAHVNPMSFEAAAEMEDRMACGVSGTRGDGRAILVVSALEVLQGGPLPPTGRLPMKL